MKPPTIGILAGMGPRSTAPFLDLVLDECQRQYGARDDIDFPKILICSQPAPFYEDRPVDHAALEAAIREGLLSLERAGADFLAIACNTAHIYHPQLARGASVPLLDMVALTAAALPATARGVALLAARPTVEAGLYQTALKAHGIPVTPVDWQAQVDHLLGATRTSTDPAHFTQLWSGLIEQARTAGAETILVACLDLSGILRHAPDTMPTIDAALCLARAIVERWRLGAARDAVI